MKLITTKNYKLNGIKIFVYSKAGMGKTFLCSTAPKPIVISNDAGLLTLTDFDIPAIEVKNTKEFYEALKWAAKSEKYETICIDNISEIAEIMLLKVKKDLEKNDPRFVYPELYIRMSKILRKLRSIKGKNVYVCCKEYLLLSESDGRIYHEMGMPGRKLINDIPYFFDVICQLKKRKEKTGKKIAYNRCLIPLGTSHREGKARTGKVHLDKYEPADLGKLFDKIKGIHNK